MITLIGPLFSINAKKPIPIAMGGQEKETNYIQNNIFSLKRSKLNQFPRPYQWTTWLFFISKRNASPKRHEQLFKAEKLSLVQ
jgi:hypothetical protein